MNQPNQAPNQGTQKPNNPNPSTTKPGQQTQQGNRPDQGGYSSPGQGNKSGQSAPADKR